VTMVLLQELFQSQDLFGDYARHWHLPLGIAIIALVALLPNGLAGLPAQWRERRQARVADGGKIAGKDDRVDTRSDASKVAGLDAIPSSRATSKTPAPRLPIQGERHV